MEIALWQYAIILPLSFLAGFVDAVAGGGGLISLPAFLMSELPIHNVIGTNKLASSMGTTLATAKFIRNGYVAWKPAIAGVLCAIAGSSVGANIALYIDPAYFRGIILVVLPLTAAYVLTRKSIETDAPPFGERKTILLAMVLAFGIGMYDGFYGPGTGTFLILLLTGIAHMRVAEANGITKVINLTTNVTALSVFLLHGTVILQLGLIAGACNIAGNYMGVKYFERNGAGSVKRLILVVLVIFFAKTIWETFFKN